ncbi:LuxR family transcriptional regulator [Cypionkella sp.]|uniref:helix-turn-helix transcriptional regulator n=2 Tax=Cypionkella sp. TaxID=2811411 RepID=UPI0026193BD9|nr:LuxR family transcriptional regulator [Cypionkella sp.]
MREQIQHIAPAGSYVALRVGFSFPEEEMNNLPDIWVEFYTTHGLVVQDPAMRWVYGNIGGIRFSEMTSTDPHQVRAHAAVFGLGHGAAVSVMASQDKGRRSYGLFFRDDRDFDNAEMDELLRIMQHLHTGPEDEKSLTNAEVEALKLQSEGLRLKQIALRLGISESAVKARLNNVKRKLGARTQSQAASIAAARRIL